MTESQPIGSLTDARQLDRLKRAVRKYLRAKYDDSYSPTKDWHKRHDEQKAEDKLVEMVGGLDDLHG